MSFLRRSLLCAAGLLLAVSPRLAAEIVINEIHANPDVKTEPVEFIELHNTGAAAVSLAGWRIADAVEFTFPAGTTIAANGYLVVAANPSALQSKFNVASVGPWSGRLSNEGERIQLRDAANSVVDEVEYGLGFPWPTVGDAPGFSIELIHPSLDNDLGGSWRASTGQSVPASATELVTADTQWRYLKGLAQPSSPATAWRAPAFNDSGWSSGGMPIGYDAALSFATPLNDMDGQYSSVYLRATFVVTNLDMAARLLLPVRYDDGFKLWINGQSVLDANAASGDLPHTGTSATTRESNAWETNSLPDPGPYLVQGTNVIAVQLLNTLLSGSSDCFLDLRLRAASALSTDGPTPGRRNAVFSSAAPPQIRQVAHAPNEPRSGQPVRISAKVTDPNGVASVSLAYQFVEPGAFIELGDPAYGTSWTNVVMNDAGANGDLLAGDDVFSATLPAAFQQHRRLIRYRITVTDTTGQTLRVPYADDPQPNFAYFVYDGVPAWTGAVNPAGSGALAQSFTVSSNEMNRLPVYHLLAKKTSVEDSTWFQRYGGDAYLWSGALVHNGRVYDHIRYRARGGVWRYAMTKNMWKFDFNRGHDFVATDNWGRPFATPWKKLNLGASIQQGDYQHRGEQGMFESVGLRLFDLAGVPAPHTAYAQFRIVDEAAQTGADQYSGDFWGVYLALEQEDGQFLDEHELPDGNLYKMENGTGELNNLGPDGPTDKSDLNYFLGAYNGASEAWWRTNLNIPAYLSYQTIVQAIHHFDICYGKNYFYYRNPETGLWQVVPWDLDLTWAENMYDHGCGGVDAIKQRLIPNANALPTVWREWQNRIRESRDLLLNEDEGWRVIEEHASLLRGPADGPTLLDADRAQWDFNPKMNSSQYSSSLGKAGTGRFYQVGGSFNGAVARMKNYLLFHATNSAAGPSNLDALAQDPQIPQRPVITYTGSNGYPANRLSFRTSGYNGANAFASMKWRIGEVSPTNTPAYLASEPWKYEIEPVWETSEITAYNAEIAVPSGVLRVGRTYRARVRFMDVTGRASRWSEPIQFVAGVPDNAGALNDNLKLTELMFNPPAGSDYEFVELRNTSADATLDLAGVGFTSGITYTFPAGATLAPGAHALVVRAAAANNFATFRAHYGLSNSVPIFGPYSGSLSDSGEALVLKAAAGGAELVALEYGDNRLWPIAADGAGHSLVPVDSALTNQADAALDYPFHWRASTRMKGSPGAVDPAPNDALVLNEIVAHTDFTSEQDSNDWIELHNRSLADITLGSGWYLSDNDGNLKKWQIPPGTVVPAGGYVVFDEVTGFHNPPTSGFGLTKSGEQVFLSHLPGDVTDRVVDAVRFAAEENDWSWGRPAHGPAFWSPLMPRTRGAANGNRPDVPRITEIHFHPLNDAETNEFVEITGAVGYGTNFANSVGAWRLDGDVAFVFPPGFNLPAQGRVLVVGFDPADTARLNAFRATFGITNQSLPILGPWTGKLSNSSGQLSLEKPQAPDLVGDPVGWILVDEAVFLDQAPWPTNADGTGASLQLYSTALPGSHPAAWTAATPTPGLVATAVQDSDGDGASDAWETVHGFDPASAADAEDDTDLDGATNAEEFAAGTDPRDAASVLRLNVGPTGPELRLLWPAAPGVAYEVQRRSTIASGAWETLTNFPAKPGPATNEVRAPATTGEAILRVRVAE